MSLNYNCWMDQHIIKNYWPRRVEKKRAQPKCTAHEFRKEKKRQFSQSTRKRRVACPFHLVYQATYRYIMQPPTRVISLDSALCSAPPMDVTNNIPLFFLFSKSPTKSSSSLSLSSCYKFCFALLTSPDPHQNERWNRFFHIYFVPPIYYPQSRIESTFLILNGHPSEIKSMAVYTFVSITCDLFWSVNGQVRREATYLIKWNTSVIQRVPHFKAELNIFPGHF